MQRVNVLQNVQLFVGQYNNVKLFQWLVHVSDGFVFDGGVLRIGLGKKAGEIGQEGGDSVFIDMSKQSGKERFTAMGTYTSSQNDHDEGRIEGSLVMVIWIFQLVFF